MAMVINFTHLTAIKSYRHKAVLRHVFIINITIKASDYKAEVFRPEALFINAKERLFFFSAVFIIIIYIKFASTYIIFIILHIFWAYPAAVDTVRARQIILIVSPVRFNAHRNAHFLYIIHIKEERRLKIYIANTKFFKGI